MTSTLWVLAVALGKVVALTGWNFTVKVGSVVDERLGFAPAVGQLQLSAGTPEAVLMLQPGCAFDTGLKPEVL